MNRSYQQDAAALIVARRRLRENLDAWAEWNGFKPAAHHRLINRKLEQVANGEIKRLAIFAPPGSAKSTYTSVLFPPWLLARNPKALILAASHTTELAERWGRRVRNIITEHEQTLHIKLSEDNQAANRWSLEEGGEYYMALLTIQSDHARMQTVCSFAIGFGIGTLTTFALVWYLGLV